MATPSARRHQDASRSIERSGVFAGVLGDRARHDVPSGFIRTTMIAESVRLLPFSGGVAYDRCRVPPSDAPQDTAACCFPPDYARLGTLPISSTLQTPLGFPTPYECDPQPRGL
jgi:hypothetical protein